MAFKMKRTPIKGLGNFFSSLGKEATGARQTKQKASNTGEYAGMTNFEKRRAEKKSRKPGESKFKADIRRKREARKAAKTTKDKKPNASLDTKIDNNFTKNVLSPTIGTDRINKTLDLKKTKSGLYDPKKAPKPEKATKPDWSKAPKVGTTARTNWYKKFNFALDETTPGYKKKTKKKITVEPNRPDLNNSMIDPFSESALRKNSPAKNYKKGYYGVK
jgi:hypothetical protein